MRLLKLYLLFAALMGGFIPLRSAALPVELDPSFSGLGISYPVVRGGEDLAAGATTDSQGRLYVLGQGRREQYVARLDPQGALDPSYGSAGIARLALPLGQYVMAGLRIDAQDRVVALGNNLSGGSVVVRLQSNGTGDPGFADGIHGELDVLTQSSQQPVSHRLRARRAQLQIRLDTADGIGMTTNLDPAGPALANLGQYAGQGAFAACIESRAGKGEQRIGCGHETLCTVALVACHRLDHARHQPDAGGLLDLAGFLDLAGLLDFTGALPSSVCSHRAQ